MFFPTLTPPMANKVWFNLNNIAASDEAEIARMEREHNNWLESFKIVGSDINPLGKVILPGPETDEEDANDDSDDSDSHDEEEYDANDRTIPGQPERSVLRFPRYSPVDDANISDDPPAGSV